MVTLAFLAVVALLFGAVLAWESEGSPDIGIRRPTGLLTWLTSGNWPAKIGGGLLIVGVGALLRYGLIHVDVAPEVKLAAGVLLAALAGVASVYAGRGPARRAVALALGGTAFGIAYLTAYSAFGLFGYLPTPQGVALLALTSIAAGLYAVTQSALSLACLAMLGAYLAPAFGLRDPGPEVVYGYYLAISLLTLVMVTLRGWRPLIHLSLLFTVAGGVFFAWTARYYAPQYADVMLPMLVAMAAVHVAMPIAERRREYGDFLARLDVIHLLAVPALTALAAVAIAPARLEFAWTLAALAAVWLAAALYLRVTARDGVAVHAVIGFVLSGFAAAARLRHLPWELIVLAFVVGTQGYALYRSTTRTLHSVLAGMALMLGALHVIGSLDDRPGAALFLNGVFIERILAAGLLILSGRIAHRARQSLDGALLWVGVGWAIVALWAELVRWDLLSLVLVAHGVLVIAAFALFSAGARRPLPGALVMCIVLGVLVTAAWAAPTTTPGIAIAMLFAAPLALAGVALRPTSGAGAEDTGRLAAATLAPLVAGIWAEVGRRGWNITADVLPLVAAVLTVLVVLIGSRRSSLRDSSWVSSAAGLFGFVTGLLLLSSTLFRIVPSAWAVLLELLCVAAAALVLFRPREGQPPEPALPAITFAAALVLQANLLRAWGPPGDLSILDLPRMQWPTLVSLLWALLGGALTVLGRRQSSRSAWIAGATLLVAAVVKFVLLDFGSLGQLTNILAVIAAGIVFLLVGWLAPMPPAPDRPSIAPASSSPPPSAQPAAPASSRDAAPTAAVTPRVVTPAPTPPVASRPATTWHAPAAEAPAGVPERRRGWMLPLVALLFIVYSRCSHDVREFLGHRVSDTPPVLRDTLPPGPVVPEGPREREVALDPVDEVILDGEPEAASSIARD